MYSFLLPPNIEIYQTPGYIKIAGPFGILIKKTGNQELSIITVTEGRRLFSVNNNSTSLSNLFQIAHGLSHGFRKRLSLTGIGFRAIMRDQIPSGLATKNYIAKRIIASTDVNESYLTLKIGFSHEVVYKSNVPRSIITSRIEGRTKGTLISLKSNSLNSLNQAAAEIRTFRAPDIYKGKGIYYAQEVIKLKKGKRQG
jgi:large subunit ribosomal protein L6